MSITTITLPNGAIIESTAPVAELLPLFAVPANDATPGNVKPVAKPAAKRATKPAKPNAKALLAEIRTIGATDPAKAASMAEQTGWAQEAKAWHAKATPVAKPAKPAAKRQPKASKPAQDPHPVLDNEPVRVPTLNKPKAKRVAPAKVSPATTTKPISGVDAWVDALRRKVATLKRDADPASCASAASELRPLYLKTQDAITEAKADNDADGVSKLSRKAKAIAEAINGLDAIAMVEA